MRTRSARLGLCVAAALAALVASGSAANAKGSHRVPVGNVPFDVPAADCGFPVHVGIVADKEYFVHTRTLADGSTYLQITGKLFESATNTSTGKTVVVNASGMAKEVIHPDGSFVDVASGHLFASVPPADQARFGIPGLLLGSGHGRGTGMLTATGFTLSSFSWHGKITNVCAELA